MRASRVSLPLTAPAFHEGCLAPAPSHPIPSPIHPACPPRIAGAGEGVLDRDIPWDTYMQARMITDRDLEYIRRYDKKSVVTKSDALAKEGQAYVDAFFNVLRNVSRDETVQYTLALLKEMLGTDVGAGEGRAALLHNVTSTNPYTQLLRLLQRPDWQTQELAATVLAIMVDTRPDRSVPLSAPPVGDLISVATSSGATEISPASPERDATMSAFVDFLANQLRQPTVPQRSERCAVHCLSLLLKEREVRDLCVRKGVIQLMAPLLAGTKRSEQTHLSVQLQYEAGLCFWQLAYNKAAADSMAASGVVGRLVQVLKGAQKEKVARVCLMALKALAAHDDLRLLQPMVEADVKRVVALRLDQEWGDPDITSALEFLRDEIADKATELSTFERYRKEVLGGSLAWTPLHTEQEFWMKNVNHFDEKDFLVLRALLKLLEQSPDATTLAVGCHDLAQFIQHHPRGRQLCHELGAKAVVMRRLEHQDPEVQRNALLAFQRILMSKNQISLAEQIGGGGAPWGLPGGARGCTPPRREALPAS